MEPGNLRIIVIGGSAGSIAPLRTILSELPTHLGAAVFVVQHGPADGVSRTAEALRGASALPVGHAIDREIIEPGRVYLARPNLHLVIERGCVRLRRGAKEPWNRPSINVLFRSAAAAYGNSVAGVILSGLLWDGITGLWDIKKAGGVAIVQSPEDAQWPEMPTAACREVPLDDCLPAAQIGRLLGRLAGLRTKADGAARRPRIRVVEDDAAPAVDLADRLAGSTTRSWRGSPPGKAR